MDAERANIRKADTAYIYPFQVACAGIASFLVAPMISIVDKAIFSNASGKERMWTSMGNSVKAAAKSPLQFVRGPSFLWIWFVYSGTYIVANTAETVSIRSKHDPNLPKFVASSTANISLSMLKDRAFSRMYGVTAPRPVPAASLALFGTRDAATIAASFNFTQLASSLLQKKYSLSKNSADVVAQLVTPISMQIVSTPLHLLGSDLYNKPEATSAQHREFIAREYIKTLTARMMRIFPAFGIGGVVNKFLRKYGHEQLAHK